MIMKQKLLDFLDRLGRVTLFPEDYPCLGCRSELPLGSHHLCEKCRKELYTVSSICPVCGRGNYEGLCKDCAAGREFERAVSPYEYKGSCRKLIAALKYHDAVYVTDMMAQNILYRCDFEFDLVTCVPSRKKAMRKRGYNQSELLAKSVAKISNRPFMHTLKNTGDSLPQHQLTLKERKRNYFHGISPLCKLNGETVLLIDDVITTGATMDACAKYLKQAGARLVYAASFASTPNIYSRKSKFH